MASRRLRILILLGCLAGCGSPNPAAPPTPPAEIPASLRIPESIEIDVDTISAPTAAAALKSLVGSGGEFSDEIAAGAAVQRTLNEFSESILEPFHRLVIPVRDDLSTFTGSIQVEGIFVDVEIKIDFSDFDFDDDGDTEGCSGHTAALPVCMRVWSAGFRSLAAVFNEFPTETNPGSGRIKGLRVQDVVGGAIGLPPLGMFYDHLDPEDRFTELFFSDVDTGHTRMNQFGPDESALKTLNVIIRESGEIPQFGKFISRFKENADFWSGTHVIDDLATEGLETDLRNICARISTGDQVNRLDCIDLGIDVEGIPFLDLPFPGDVLFPEDFPFTPTF